MERKILQEFIEIYRSEPALWKMKSCYYNNKGVKNAAYHRLLGKLRELYPDADLDMVKKKINALRTNFRKEQRKVEASRERSAQTGEPVYVPSLWYYELFHFIADQENELKPGELDAGFDVHDMLKVDLDENVYFEGDESDENYDEDYQVSSPESSKATDNGARLAPQMMAPMMMPEHRGYKRKRDPGYSASYNSWYSREEQPHGSRPYALPALSPAPQMDSNEIFGRYVASRLKKMDKPMQMLSERLISEVLYLGQMGHLNNDFVITKTTKARDSTDGESETNNQ